MAKKLFRGLCQPFAGEHVISLPGIRIAKKLTHPAVSSARGNQADLRARRLVSHRDDARPLSRETKDRDLKTGKLKRLDIAKKPATGHLGAELAK
jgi:hypothetical protein